MSMCFGLFLTDHGWSETHSLGAGEVWRSAWRNRPGGGYWIRYAAFVCVCCENMQTLNHAGEVWHLLMLNVQVKSVNTTCKPVTMWRCVRESWSTCRAKSSVWMATRSLSCRNMKTWRYTHAAEHAIQTLQSIIIKPVVYVIVVCLF